MAMANKLDAYEQTDYEFAQAAFEFVGRDVYFEMCPLDSAEATLMRGTGSCVHLVNVFIALCRSAGIKARYKFFEVAMSSNLQNQFVDIDPLFSKMYGELGQFMTEAQGEAYIDGTWVVAHPGAIPEFTASAGGPIIKFGEDPIVRDPNTNVVPGTLTYPESMPLRLGSGMAIFNWLAPAPIERMNMGAEIFKSISVQSAWLSRYLSSSAS